MFQCFDIFPYLQLIQGKWRKWFGEIFSWRSWSCYSKEISNQCCKRVSNINEYLQGPCDKLYIIKSINPNPVTWSLFWHLTWFCKPYWSKMKLLTISIPSRFGHMFMFILYNPNPNFQNLSSAWVTKVVTKWSKRGNRIRVKFSVGL